MGSMINTVETFLATFHEGDIFWYIQRSLGHPPSSPEGPCRIIHISQYRRDKESPMVTFMFTPLLSRREEVATWHIKDIVNEHHGVFTNEPDAHTYFQEQKEAYKTSILMQIVEVEKRMITTRFSF